MLIQSAAKRLEMSPQTLRLALQQNLFPFGTAIRTSEHRYTYFICEERLNAYLEARDFKLKGVVDGGKLS